MDPIKNILSRLDGVKETKPDQWVAVCPSHSDRNPSLAIKRGDDGRVLLKCWAGCSAADVVEAAGLELRDLFEQLIKYNKPTRERLYPNHKHIHQLLQQHIWLVFVIACDMRERRDITKEAMDVLSDAIADINKMLDACNV